ncbi:UvrD-helicase domain-containing protein [Candidatus Trichorickettsia mobilis]|uniref:UvrD-helicase domain-containing protein n=1 Tax=Candidatus Trichorickettsia mobilis TaxID=1346319 RepID=UPI00292E1DA5|nr:UvrD-helicase domain-containing protein [Candidatus Trichorickettsia mobilis]
MNNLQLKASNPENSVWVSASAGTGKTKILTDRVLRLLISGVPPQKILCLTFTNAAAGEMQHRIYNKLEAWTKADDNQLMADLRLLTGLAPNREELEYIRTIYHKLLDYHNIINIYTIHSFCQKILKTFPIEAGLSPGFQILDNLNECGILNALKQQIYIDPLHEKIASFLSMNFHEMTINDIINEIIDNKLKFKNLFENHSTVSENVNHSQFSRHPERRNSHPEPSISYSELVSGSHEVLTKSRNKFGITDASSDETQIRDALRQLIEAYDNPIALPDNLFTFFLTNDGNKRKQLIARKIYLNNLEFAAKLDDIQELVYQFDQDIKTERLLEYSNILLELAKALITIYDEYKNQKNLLDYDDLIFYTKELLTKKATKDWVLYKLDGGIDHLLVDEAQDTSPEQWQIIESLIGEFYAGDSVKRHRTIFVVGDEKQSIFSFQGADTNSFNIVKDHLKQRLIAANKNFEIINLELSYRSATAILDVVYNVFQQIKNCTPALFLSDNPLILPTRKTSKGRVELWNLISTPKNCEELFWPLPEDYQQFVSPAQTLAIKIAEFIKDQINSRVINLDTGLPLTAGDFMILVRKRDQLTNEVIKQLKNYGLAVAGIDRMTLSKNLSVIDLISAAKFVLAPNDDLNLAHLIKSSIIGGNEEDLYKLALIRQNLSIWQVLQNNIELNNIPHYQMIYKKLKALNDLYQNTHAGNFFHIIIDNLSLRKIFLQLNGIDDSEAINELLYLCYNYADKIDISLQAFIYWFEASEIEVQRNVEASDKIRVMTIHGAKGLQAPVVILCDTTTIPINQSNFVWTDDSQVLYSMSMDQAPQILKELKQHIQNKDLQEYLRLLYVAMTRAADHLIICGYSMSEKLPEYCWYSLVASAMRGMCRSNEDGAFIYGDQQQQVIHAFKHEPKVVPNVSAVDISVLSRENFDWTLRLPKCLHKNNATITVMQDRPAISLLVSNNHFQYGRIFHKILEDSVKGRNIHNIYTHPLIATLPELLRCKILISIANILSNNEFINIISWDEVKTEVNIGVLQDNQTKIGRIDLLSISSDKLIIIDYKSDAHPPMVQHFISTDYINQLNFYRSIMQEIYPRHNVVCKILWLENGSFMTVD